MKDDTIWETKENFSRFHCIVKTQKNKFNIQFLDQQIVIEVKSSPFRNKANKEIINKLSKLLGISSSSIRIISGSSNPHKLIEVELDAETTKKRLLNK